MELRLLVNGEQAAVQVRPNETLSQLLREQLGLTGSKICCEEGECGACTVLLNRRSVNSCITLAAQAADGEIVTIEGLAREGKLDPIQEAFIEEGAVQCGFCIPGMIMSAKALLLENGNPEESEIREALSGNLCRCAGYYLIIQAVQSAARMSENRQNTEERMSI